MEKHLKGRESISGEIESANLTQIDFASKFIQLIRHTDPPIPLPPSIPRPRPPSSTPLPPPSTPPPPPTTRLDHDGSDDAVNFRNTDAETNHYKRRFEGTLLFQRANNKSLTIP